MTGHEALEQMRALYDTRGDNEADHTEADKILVELLRSLGFNALCDIYDSFVKWYA